MVSVSAVQAPYLASATTLIKALKSPHDPPQPDWPHKIEIASQAWKQKEQIGHGIGGRVGDIVREWLLESWIRTKGTKGARNSLLNSSYHDLLRTIIQDTPSSSSAIISTTQSHQFLTAFLLSLRLSPEFATEELLFSASQTFNVLFSYDVSSSSKDGASKVVDETMSGVLVRAESWLETLGGLLALCSYLVDAQSNAAGKAQPTTSSSDIDAEHSQGLLKITQLVVLETNASLAISQTRRKITLNIIKPLVPTFLKVVHSLPLIQASLQMLVGPLFWPLAILQPQTQSSQASSTESMQDPSETIIRELVLPTQADKTIDPQTLLATLSFVPALSQEYVNAVQSNRYSIFPPPSSSGAGRSKIGSKIPPDVYVGDKVREAVRGYVKVISQCLDEVWTNLQSSVEGGKGGAASTTVFQADIMLEISKTRYALWTVVKQWGGYFEGDEAWRQLVTEAVGVASGWLSATGFRVLLSEGKKATDRSGKPARGGSTSTNATESEREIFTWVEKLFSTLLELDYGACKVNVEEEGMRVLAASLLAQHAGLPNDALPSIQVALRYHTLTQSIPDFAALMALVVQYCFSSTVTTTTPRDIYVRLASGPLVTIEFQNQLEKAASGAFVGGVSEERGWGKIVICLGDALRREQQLLEAATIDTPVQAQTEVPSKRRRKNDGTSAPVSSSTVDLSGPAGSFAVLSRLLAVVLHAAYAKGHGFEKNGKADDVIALVDRVADVWKVQAGGTFGDEVIAGLTRLRRVDQLLRREVYEVVQPVVEGQNEALFEEVGVKTSALTNKPSSQPISGLLTRLAAQQPSATWTGKIVDLQSGSLSTALWHVVAQRGLSIIEEIATDEELDSFATLLLNTSTASSCATAEVHPNELLVSQAIQRISRSAEFWELARTRSAVLKAIQSRIGDGSSINDTAVFAFLLGTPSDFLNRNVRSMAIKRAYTIDASSPGQSPAKKVNASDRALVRRFMVKVIKNTEYTGPLAEADVVMRLISETISTSDEVEGITQELISLAISALLRDSRTPKSKDALTLLVASLHQKFAEASPPLQQARLFKAIYQLFNDAISNFDGLAEKILSPMTSLSSSVLSTFTSQLQEDDQSLFNDRQKETVMRITILSAVTAYRSKLSLKTEKEERENLAGHLCVRALREFSVSDRSNTSNTKQLASSLLQWVTVQSNPSQNVVDMKAFFSKWIAFIALLGKSPSLEVILQEVFASATEEVFGALLELLTRLLEREREDAPGVLVPTLRALNVVSRLTIPHTGRIYRGTLARILSGLRNLLQYPQSPQVQLESLELLEVISAEKTVILVHQDVSDMLAVCYAAVLRSQMKASPLNSRESTSRDTAHPHLVSILSIVNTLVRHRRDLVINVLPQVMKLYARIFVLFGTPRGRGSTGASADRALRRIKKDWPTWLGDESADSLGAEDARLFARSLVTLSSRTTIRSTSTSSTNTGTETMIGQLSKHAPVLLIAYVRAVAHPLYTIPAPSRHELVPGIAAMCEAVVAGGKSMLGGLGAGGNENRSAESVGEAFGLGEGPGGEGELILWGDMWRAWRRSRYVGQG
ncbi:hypothetical protein QFC22_005513 [Naganishia vaughanmartiniae]|uniref:Uncharacterized protein n=1 Tax=Naganishia vaughanmartiniae TaxID=1424756 RepID=A0ACC2WS80_9TREE|nr:hypothetical protein QFC22_005513 [Naganishia vaughanmartiniae]